MKLPQLLKRLVAIGLSVGLGLIFLYSGYTKLLPVIETFEFTFVEIGIANWYVAPVLARLVIAAEIFTGMLLIACFRLRDFTLRLTIGVLVFFSLYLLIQIIITGNEGNCGCFGEHHKMTPLQGILKNLIMIVMAGAVFYMYKGWTSRFGNLLMSLVAVTSLVLPFVLNPVDYSYTSNNLNEKVNYPLGVELLYNNNDSGKVETPAADLRKGKHVVAFLSLSCHHCRIAAKKLRLIKKNNPMLPVYFILNGNRSKYQAFIDDTKAQNVPSSFCLGKTFVQLAGNRLPRIYYLDDGRVVKKVDYYELSQSHIEEWVSK